MTGLTSNPPQNCSNGSRPRTVMNHVEVRFIAGRRRCPRVLSEDDVVHYADAWQVPYSVNTLLSVADEVHQEDADV